MGRVNFTAKLVERLKFKPSAKGKSNQTVHWDGKLSRADTTIGGANGGAIALRYEDMSLEELDGRLAVLLEKGG